jgi:hypothetical protein
MSVVGWVATGVGVLLWAILMIGYYALLRYLFAGTRAFELYIELHEDPIGRPAPLVPDAPRHAHRAGTSWGGS